MNWFFFIFSYNVHYLEFMLESIKKNRILLLTKNYPPQVGGSEKYSFDLHQRLIREGYFIRIIKTSPRNEKLLYLKSKSIFYLILYYFSEYLRLGIFAFKSLTIWFYYALHSDVVWSLDGSISWLAYILSKLTLSRSRTMFLGKDLTWNNKVYQRIMPYIWKNIDEIYSISPDLSKIAISYWIKPNIINLLECKDDQFIFPKPGNFIREDFLKKYNIPTDRILFLSLWRFVEKKGIHWFLSDVLPFLDLNKCQYIIAGAWELQSLYEEIILKNNLSNVTFTWPIIDPVEKARLYSSVDFFIMPNISVPWDFEWYGLVLLEAQYYNLKCIVSDADGLWGRTKNHDMILSARDGKKWVQFLRNLLF